MKALCNYLNRWWIFCHHLFSLKLFQTGMIFFLLLNTNKIFWRMSVTV